MTISFNDKPYEVTSGTTLAKFLTEHKINPARTIFERNGEVLDPGINLDDLGLNDGDRINAFSLVAGG